MSIILNQSIHGKCSYIRCFCKMILCYVAVIMQWLCPYIDFSLYMLNKDEPISKLIFGISICGAAWSYNNVKQLQIGHVKCTCIRHWPNTFEFVVLPRPYKITVCAQKRPCKNIIIFPTTNWVRSSHHTSTVVLNLVDADPT